MAGFSKQDVKNILRETFSPHHRALICAINNPNPSGTATVQTYGENVYGSIDNTGGGLDFSVTNPEIKNHRKVSISLSAEVADATVTITLTDGSVLTYRQLTVSGFTTSVEPYQAPIASVNITDAADTGINGAINLQSK